MGVAQSIQNITAQKAKKEKKKHHDESNIYEYK